MRPREADETIRRPLSGTVCWQGLIPKGSG
jgi:hypothetical protein